MYWFDKPMVSQSFKKLTVTSSCTTPASSAHFCLKLQSSKVNCMQQLWPVVYKEKFLALCFLSFGPEFLYHDIKGSGLTFLSLRKRDIQMQEIWWCYPSPGYKTVLVFPYSHPKFATTSELRENTSRNSGWS